MSKPAPSRLAGLKFMQGAAARTTNSSAQAQDSRAASSSGSAGRTPAGGSVGAKPAPKVSSKLMGLKFMQKAVQKQAVKEQVKEHAERLEQERFVIRAEHQTRGCVVVHDDTPLVATTTGRMSFGNFNPAVEKSNTELRQLVAEVQEEAARRTDTITDEEMAERLTQSRLSAVKDEVAAPGEGAPALDGAGSGTSAVKVEAESESKEAKKRRRAKSELMTKLKKLKKAKVG